jgi:hypothetical protein
MEYFPLFSTTFVKKYHPDKYFAGYAADDSAIHTALLLCLILEVRRDWPVFESCNKVQKH